MPPSRYGGSPDPPCRKARSCWLAVVVLHSLLVFPLARRGLASSVWNSFFPLNLTLFVSAALALAACCESGGAMTWRDHLFLGVQPAGRQKEWWGPGRRASAPICCCFPCLLAALVLWSGEKTKQTKNQPNKKNLPITLGSCSGIRLIVSPYRWRLGRASWFLPALETLPWSQERPGRQHCFLPAAAWPFAGAADHACGDLGDGPGSTQLQKGFVW